MSSRIVRHVRRALRARWGVFPVVERWLKVRHVLGAVRLWVFEHREVRRLARRLGAAVEADVVTVVATFRRPELAAAAIRSALAQTVDDHHVIVVDDGGGQLPQMADPRLTMVSLSRNCGTAGVVRNVGIRLTTSRLVAFLDDDNRWLPEHLATSIAAHGDGATFTYTALRRARLDGTEIDVLSVPFDRAELRERAFVDTSAVVVRRDRRVRFSRVPRDRGTVPGEDWELVHRLSRRLVSRHVPKTTVEYLVHDGSYYSNWADE